MSTGRYTSGLEDSAHGRCRPATTQPAPAANLFGIQILNESLDRLSIPKVAEDPEGYLGFRSFDFHPVTVGPWPSPPIDPHLAYWHRLVAVRRFANRETPGLLPLLPAQRLLPE